MTTIRFPATISALCLAAAATFAPLAAAAQDTDAPTVQIRLDTATLVAGDNAGQVRSRIVAAAHRVCQPDDRSLVAQQLARACFAKAVRTAQAQYVTLRQAQLATMGKAALAVADTKPAR